MTAARPVSVIFDLDGVLWNSTPHHAAGYRRALRTAGIRDFDYRTISGMGTRAAMKKLLEAAGRPAGPEDVARLAAEKSRISSRLLTEKPPVRRSTVALLRRLAARRPVALASSASAKTVGLFLRATRAARLFSAVVSADDVRRAKPFPDLYRRALALMKCRPSAAVVVEDAVSGIQAARAARIPVVGLAGTESAARLKAAGALRVFRTLREVERYVDGL